MFSFPLYSSLLNIPSPEPQTKVSQLILHLTGPSALLNDKAGQDKALAFKNPVVMFWTSAQGKTNTVGKAGMEIWVSDPV